jgi:hypothetical protein
MMAALLLPAAPEAVRAADRVRECVQVLESRSGVREVLLVTSGSGPRAQDEHAVIILSGGGGGFAVTCPDGVPRVQGGLPVSQRHRLASSIGGPVMALSPPSDRPVMDREWRMSERHVVDLQAAVDWTKTQWPSAKTWVRGVNNGALSAAVATANLESLEGAILIACSDEAFDQPQKSDRMRMLAVRYRRDASLACAAVARTWGRKTLVTVHDERAQHAESTYSEAANRPRLSGKDFQVVDVVSRWILTGTAPDEIR